MSARTTCALKFLPFVLLLSAPAWSTTAQQRFETTVKREASFTIIGFHPWSDDFDDEDSTAIDVRPDVDGKGSARGFGVRPFWGHHGASVWLEGASPKESIDPVAAPEPGSLGLLATGLVGLAGLVRRTFAN